MVKKNRKYRYQNSHHKKLLERIKKEEEKNLCFYQNPTSFFFSFKILLEINK